MEMVQDNIDELVSRDSLSSYLLKQISDLSGISMPELSLEVVRLFANPDSHISSAVWLSLAGIVAEKADQAEGLAALRRLLTGNAVRLAGMVADGGFSPELYPDANEVDVCAGLVWLQLGSPSSIDRWRAAHSLRRFARLDQWDVIDSVVTRTTVPTLFEQNQLVGAVELVRSLHGERKQLIERSFLEQGQAQNL